MDTKKPISKRRSIREIILTEEELNLVNELKTINNYKVMYGPTIQKLAYEACFVSLTQKVENSKTLYYFLKVTNPEMVKHTKIIVDLHKHFKHYFSINYKQKGKEEILVQIKQKRKTTRALKESAFLLITTILRGLDQENRTLWNNTTTEVKTVEDMIYFFHQKPRYGHYIWKGFSNNNYEGTVSHKQIEEYLNTIKTVFAEPNYDLEKEEIGENIRQTWNRGRGMDYAFEVVKQITKKTK